MDIEQKQHTLDNIFESLHVLQRQEQACQLGAERERQLREFISTTINGDEPVSHVVMSASLKKDTPGIIIFVLTHLRLIKVDVDAHEILQSSSFLLSAMTSVTRSMLEGDRVELQIFFRSDSFGLRYPSKKEDITRFFQNVEQWVTRQG